MSNIQTIDYIDSLLTEFEDNRKSLKKLLDDLDSFKLQIDKILPTSLDKRFIRFFEEKVKTITSLFNVILDVRKEISKSLKDEIEIRRKITREEGEEEIDIDKVIDIRSLIKRVEASI